MLHERNVIQTAAKGAAMRDEAMLWLPPMLSWHWFAIAVTHQDSVLKVMPAVAAPSKVT